MVSCCFVSALALVFLEGTSLPSSLKIRVPPPSSSNRRPSLEALAILIYSRHPISSDPPPLPGWGDPGVVPDWFVDSVGKSNLSI